LTIYIMKKKGLTLLEIIVAAMIMALVMAGIANIFVAAKRHIFHTRFRMTGSELGHWYLDPLAEQVRQDKWGSNCLSSNPTDCLKEKVSQSLDNKDYNPKYEIEDAVKVIGTPLPLSKVRKVKVKIEWKEDTL